MYFIIKNKCVMPLEIFDTIEEKNNDQKNQKSPDFPKAEKVDNKVPWKNDIDNQNDKKENVENKEKLSEQELKNIESKISKMSDKWFSILQEDPNKISIPNAVDTFKEQFKTVLEASEWKWDKSIPSFEKKYNDWNSTRVRSTWQDISFSIWSENKNIQLSFNNILWNEKTKDNPENKPPIELTVLSKNINPQESLDKILPWMAKNFKNGIHESNDIKYVLDTMEKIDNLIMSPRRQEIHAHAAANKEKMQKIIDTEQSGFELFSKYYDNEEKIKNYIKGDMIKIDDLWKKTLNKSAMFYEEAVLYTAIKILQRHNSLQKILKTLEPYKNDNQEKTQTNADIKSINSWEQIVEFVSNNPNFITKKNEIIALAKEESIKSKNQDDYDQLIQMV